MVDLEQCFPLVSEVVKALNRKSYVHVSCLRNLFKLAGISLHKLQVVPLILVPALAELDCVVADLDADGQLWLQVLR